MKSSSRYLLSLTSEQSRWSTGPSVLHGLIVTVVKVVQVSDVTVLDAHETGQTLHVLVSVKAFGVEVRTTDHRGTSNTRTCRQTTCSGVKYSRGLAFSQQQAGQAEFQLRLHHLAAQRFQLQRQIVLGLRGIGKLLHVDVG